METLGLSLAGVYFVLSIVDAGTSIYILRKLRGVEKNPRSRVLGKHTSLWSTTFRRS